jgi:hypothetical protein
MRPSSEVIIFATATKWCSGVSVVEGTAWVWKRVVAEGATVAPSATARLHTTATHAAPSTTETPEHHFVAVANIITPEDGRIRPKHVESYNTSNKAIRLCIKLDTYSPQI